MVSDVKKATPNNRILVSKDRNCSKITAGNMSKRAPYQCNVSTAIER